MTWIRRHPLALLLAFLPLALIAHLTHWGDSWVFAFSTLSIVPLAHYLGQATEALARYTGPRWGALLNATLGNAAELIITLAALNRGLVELVKASITGSIIGNLLLVMGAAMLLGGLRHGLQRFNKRQAGTNAVLLMLAVAALAVPTFLSDALGPPDSPRVTALSLGVAGAMLLLYVLYLIFAWQSQPSITGPVTEAEAHPWSLKTALGILILTTLGVAGASELLVGAVEHVVTQFAISEAFLGVILIPIIGNVAEHLVAIQMALQDEMDLSVEVAVASSLQIALLVAPLLVFIGAWIGHPLKLVFNRFEMMALGVGILATALVSADGESHWLEGAELLLVYFIFALAFFLHP